MYPTAVIVLVALQKSHLDHQFTFPPSMDSRTTDIETLPFTVKAGHSKESQLGTTTAGTYDSSTSTRYEVETRSVALQTVCMPTSESISETRTGKESAISPVTDEGVGLAR